MPAALSSAKLIDDKLSFTSCVTSASVDFLSDITRRCDIVLHSSRVRCATFLFLVYLDDLR